MKMSKKLAREIVGSNEPYNKFLQVSTRFEWIAFMKWMDSLLVKECRRVLAKKGGGK